jgi:cell division protein FtsB
MKSTSKQRNKGSNPGVVKQRIHAKRIAYSLILALIGAVLYYFAYQYTYQAKLEKQYRQTQVQLQEKAKSLEKTTSDKAQLQEQIKQLEQQKQDLQNQLQAKLDAKRQFTAVASLPTVRVIKPLGSLQQAYQNQTGDTLIISSAMKVVGTVRQSITTPVLVHMVYVKHYQAVKWPLRG